MTPFETEAVLASVARLVCHAEGVRWERDDDPHWTRLADRGDAIRREIDAAAERERMEPCPHCLHPDEQHTSTGTGIMCQHCSDGWCVAPF